MVEQCLEAAVLGDSLHARNNGVVARDEGELVTCLDSAHFRVADTYFNRLDTVGDQFQVWLTDVEVWLVVVSLMTLPEQ